jgi:phage baseplate assembly protein W
MGADIIGRGWRFPIEPDASGALGYVGDVANLDQSLRILLQSDGRVMRPSFGCKAGRLVFAPGSPHFLGQLEVSVREAIRDWEPRVEVEEVSAELSPQDETVVWVAVRYRPRASNTRENLVFPLYLENPGVGR